MYDDNVYVFLIPLASTSSGNDHIICIICLQSCFLMSKLSNLGRVYETFILGEFLEASLCV